MNAFTSRIRRVILGPTNEEISAESQALGGPPYPIPPLSTTAPTMTTGYDTAGWLDDTEELDTRRSVTIRADGTVVPSAVYARQKAQDTIARNRVNAAIAQEQATNDLGINLPSPGRPYPVPDLDRPIPNLPDAGDPMTDDPRAYDEPGNEADGLPPSPYPRHVAVNDPTPDPVTDSGVHALDDSDREQITVTMTVTRYTNDLLRETAAMLPEDSDARDGAIVEFYRRLLTAAPYLGSLFPPDLLTAAHGSGSPGALQRDRLLDAILALADTYGAGRAAMERLDNVIVSMGHRHAAFARADGSVEGATEQEYDAVIAVFLGLLADALGDKFTDLHRQAWTRALRYVKVGMLWAQFHSDASFPRAPRAAADR